jgi:hypothetical protein
VEPCQGQGVSGRLLGEVYRLWVGREVPAAADGVRSPTVLGVKDRGAVRWRRCAALTRSVSPDQRCRTWRMVAFGTQHVPVVDAVSASWFSLRLAGDEGDLYVGPDPGDA